MTNKTARYRAGAFDRQGGRCYYCRRPMWNADPEAFARMHHLTIRQAAALRCTAEHLVACCNGGTTRKDNIVAACLHCNQTRHRKKRPPDPLQWATVQTKRFYTRGLSNLTRFRNVSNRMLEETVTHASPIEMQ